MRFDRASGPERIGVLIICVVLAAAAGSTTYREVRLSQPAIAAMGGLRIEVQRGFLNEEALGGGVGDNTALIVGLTVSNPSQQMYSVKASALWCLLEVDVTRPGETRLLPPSVDGEGAFPGELPDPPELKQIEVPAGQTRSFWVLFRGYQFPGSNVPWRVTLRMPGLDGNPLQLVLADPARGFLRWDVAPKDSAWMVGFEDESFYGGYLAATSASTRIARISEAGPLLWDVGVAVGLVVETNGALRSPTSSFEALGIDAHLTAPIWNWGPSLDPRRVGVYVGAETQTLIALERPRPAGDKTLPPAYGTFEPDVGLELDIGARRTASTPFPLSNSGRNPVPRWLVRYGYTHAWVGHGTSDGFVTSFRIVW